MLALISDIHANLEALQAVLARLDELQPSEILCLGDVVGYGASPVECIQEIRKRASVWIRGNHEQGLLFYAQDFNPRAKAALDWTRKQIRALEPPGLRGEIWMALDATPEMESYQDGRILLVHGSPSDPIREYVLPRAASDPQKLARWFKDMGTHQLCFLGHSHIPSVLFEEGGLFLPTEENPAVDVGGRRCIVNVGSVGQPRDGNTKACFVTLEGEGKITFHRVAYDIQSAVNRILSVPQLPEALAERLEMGR